MRISYSIIPGLAVPISDRYQLNSHSYGLYIKRKVNI